MWRSTNLTDGTYLATPDASWDIIVGIEADGRTQVMLAGQATKPVDVPYSGGTSSVVVSFAASVYMPLLPAAELLDDVRMLPTANGQFELLGHTFAVPEFENAEDMVNEMMRHSLLAHDELVRLADEENEVSARAFQRHFLKATGMTRKQLQQILRAQEAVRLLQQGKKPVDAAVDAGYADQPHMAKSLKKIMHSKPSNVADIHKL